MAGELGNKFAMKLPTADMRKMAYESYCAHIAKGKNKKSWSLKSSIRISWYTMEKYIKEFADEFDLEEKEIAESTGLGRWEQVVEDSAEGKNQKANTASLQMLMRNKFGWDKGNDRPESTNDAAMQAHEHLLAQIAQKQQEVQVEASNECSAAESEEAH